MESPFDPTKRCLAIGREVSTKYQRRNRAEFEKIAAYLNEMIQSRKGNYMAFFPSYRLMQDVYAVYEELYADENVTCLIQESAMREQEREAFLEAFAKDNEKTLVGFCIMGGIFSEGIDLDGEKLIGAAVVGAGIPQVGPERELLKQYFDRSGENGFDYAYRYPGMNKYCRRQARDPYDGGHGCDSVARRAVPKPGVPRAVPKRVGGLPDCAAQQPPGGNPFVLGEGGL
mgnify:CR=1 FL=1